MKLSFTPFFKRMSLDEQIEFTQNVVNELNKNPKYSSLLIQVTDLSVKLGEWENAANEAKFGGKMRAIKRIEKGLTVFNQLDFLSNQVEVMNYGRKGIVEVAGYNACKNQVLSPISNTNLLSEVKELQIVSS